MSSFIPCPCCGNQVFSECGSYEICPVCHWEDDPIQLRDPDYAGGENAISLNSARNKWIKMVSEREDKE